MTNDTFKIITNVESCTVAIVASGVTLKARRDAGEADAIAYRLAAITVATSLKAGVKANAIAADVRAAVNRGDVLKRDVITSDAGIGYLGAVGTILLMPNADTLIVTGREIMALIFNKIKMPILKIILGDASDAVDALDKITASIAAAEKQDDNNNGGGKKAPASIADMIASAVKIMTATGERAGDWTPEDIAAARALATLATAVAEKVGTAVPVAAAA